MNCVKCGAGMPPGAKLCEDCGALAPDRIGQDLTPTSLPTERTFLDHRPAGSLIAEAGEPVLRLADTIRIGRTPDNDIVLDDPKLSRHHATITRDDGGYTLADLGSMNGTFLNGRRIARSRRLREGDRIQMGDTRLQFHWLPLPGEIQSTGSPVPQAPLLPAAPLTARQGTRMAQDSSPGLLWTMILLGLAAALLFMAAVAAMTYIVVGHWPQNPSPAGGQPTTSLGAPILTGPPLPTTGGSLPVSTPSPP